MKNNTKILSLYFGNKLLIAQNQKLLQNISYETKLSK